MSTSRPNTLIARRRWMFRFLLAGFVPVLVLAAELLVRLTGAGLPTAEEVQRLNPAGLPIFECRKVGPSRQCSTSPWFTGFIGVQKFALPKPNGTRRIFCLGESAAEGYPFHLPGSFPRLMQVMLNESEERRFEIINVAVRGIRSSDVRQVCAEIVHYQPDLVIAYLGNNEYVGLDPAAEAGRTAGIKYWLRARLLGFRLYHVFSFLRFRLSTPAPGSQDFRDAARATNERLLRRSWDDRAVRAVQLRFARNLSDIIDLTRGENALPVLAPVAVNLRDFIPFPDAADSLPDRCAAPRPGSTVEPAPEALQERAECLARRTWPPDENLPAATAYHEGCCALWQGLVPRARELFSLARDRDRFRSRTTSAMNDLIRREADARSLPLVDVEAVFAAHSPDGIPGDELFLDYVHPVLSGQVLIAEAMIEELARQGMLRLDDPLRHRMRRAAEEYLHSLPPGFLSISYLTLANNLANYGMFPRALRTYRLALEQDPTSPDIRRSISSLEQHMAEDRPK